MQDRGLCKLMLPGQPFQEQSQSEVDGREALPPPNVVAIRHPVDDSEPTRSKKNLPA